MSQNGGISTDLEEHGAINGEEEGGVMKQGEKAESILPKHDLEHEAKLKRQRAHLHVRIEECVPALWEGLYSSAVPFGKVISRIQNTVPKEDRGNKSKENWREVAQLCAELQSFWAHETARQTAKVHEHVMRLRQEQQQKIDRCGKEDTEKVEVVFAINCHENVPFLIQQLRNIELHVKVRYTVVLNCNAYMFVRVADNSVISQMPHIFVNPEYMEKRRYHGSLTRGIHSNMRWAMHRMKFEWLVVLSSRTMFYNDLDSESLLRMRLCPGTHRRVGLDGPYSWHWSIFCRTKLARHLADGGAPLVGCVHEGLVLSAQGCRAIAEYLEVHVDIREELFRTKGCVEEFALQSISHSYGGGFYYIGTGSKTTGRRTEALPPGQLVHKVERV
jgi:hypothetical protein